MAISQLITRPDIIPTLAAQIRRGVPLATACTIAGVDVRAVEMWKAIAMGRQDTYQSGSPPGPEVREKMVLLVQELARAAAEREASAVGIVADAAETTGKSGVKEWRAAAWLLNNHPAYREAWHEQREVSIEQTGTITHEHRLARQLSDDDLRVITTEPPPLLLDMPQSTQDPTTE